MDSSSQYHKHLLNEFCMTEPNALLCAKNSVTSSTLSNVKVGEIQCRRKKHRADIVEDKKKITETIQENTIQGIFFCT